MNLARTANYRYKIDFSEDFQHAELKIQGNLAVFCCCCCPCIPAWCTLPTWMCNQYMEQAEGSIEGDHWVRYRGICCQKPEYYYDLKTVYDADGKETRFSNLIALEAPKQVMISF